MKCLVVTNLCTERVLTLPWPDVSCSPITLLKHVSKICEPIIYCLLLALWKIVSRPVSSALGLGVAHSAIQALLVFSKAIHHLYLSQSSLHIMTFTKHSKELEFACVISV